MSKKENLKRLSNWAAGMNLVSDKYCIEKEASFNQSDLYEN